MSSPAQPPLSFPKSDAGSGALKDYKYNLVPVNARVIIQLAGSDLYQEELQALIGEDALQSFISPRTAEEERTDAPMPVRFFTGKRMSGIVGWVPRGLEPAVIEAISRLENSSNKRIPVEVIRRKGKLRVNLLMGETR